jgi:hypothetical protein
LIFVSIDLTVYTSDLAQEPYGSRALFQGTKPRLQTVVGAIDQADTAAAFLRDGKDVPPEMNTMAIQMGQNQVYGGTQVLGGASFGSPLP